VQVGTCTASSGRKASCRVGDEHTPERDGLRVFAGQRLDPFFIDLAAESANHALEQLTFTTPGVNTGEGANCLSIVVELDVATVLGPDVGPLLAVVGETLVRGHPVRLERMGRPEIKNFTLQDRKFDQLNRDVELRDLYNTEDAFHLSEHYVEAYRARLNGNLAFFDRLDHRTDWPADERGNHPLTELLLADFLVVDTSKPFTDGAFLEIERALLAGRPHTTCGGRPLNDDIVDIFYTLLVGGVDGAPISDGVDQATLPAALRFPYLRRPSLAPPDLAGVLAKAAAAPAAEVSSS
jgi:hypothetical protein